VLSDEVAEMGTRVLLADDSITIQKLVEMAFGDTDFELVCVSDGQQAIEKLAEFKPQIVLADAIMPVKDGYQVCDYLRHQPAYRDIPVVLLTGRFQPYDEARSKQVGITERIVKPFVQDQLVALVRQLVPELGQDTLELEGEESNESTPDLLAEELLEPMEEAVSSVEAADMSLDSHATIRVKPDDLKAFLREVERPAVEELDLDQESTPEVEELDLNEEEDVETSFSKSFDSLELEVPPELLQTPAIQRDKVEELDLDETVTMEGAPTFAGSFFSADEPSASSSQPEEDLEKTLRLQDGNMLELTTPDPELWQVELPDANQVRTVSFEEPAPAELAEEDVWTAPAPVLNSPVEAEPELLTDWEASEVLPDRPDFHSDSFELQPPHSLDFEPVAELRAEDDQLDLDADLATEPVEMEHLVHPAEPAQADELMELDEFSEKSAAMDVRFEGESVADWSRSQQADEEPAEEELLELIEEDEQASIPTENLDETFYPELEEPLGHNLPLDSREDRIDTGPVDLPLEVEEAPLLTEDSLPDLPDMAEEPAMGELVSSFFEDADPLDSPQAEPAQAEPAQAELPEDELPQPETWQTEDFPLAAASESELPFDEPFGESIGEANHESGDSLGMAEEPAAADFVMEEAVLLEEEGIGSVQAIEEPLVSELDEEVLQTQEPVGTAEPEMEEWLASEDAASVPAESPVAPSHEEEDTASHLALPVLPSLELDEKPRSGAMELSQNQLDYLVEAVARRVVELLSDEAVKEIAWEVIPELSEAMIKKRIYELEKSVDAD
jgi:CheY-like chemotaxis protein